MTIKAPFPWFGGKSSVAEAIWRRLGSPKQYIEPFCGSAAILLAAPSPASLEVIGDANCYVANFWRALKLQPDAVIAAQDYPVSHIDLFARHRWLTEPTRVAVLRDALLDPEWPGDAKIAGWWLWGQCCWVGDAWCDPARRPAVSATFGKSPRVTDGGVGAQSPSSDASAWLRSLSDRLARVRVIHGDWRRCLVHDFCDRQDTAVLLDPPILLLDEPTSSMDFSSEEQLKGRLRSFTEHKTMVIVTHRLSLLDLAQRIIVVDGGQVVADGPRDKVVEALQSGKVGRAAS